MVLGTVQQHSHTGAEALAHLSPSHFIFLSGKSIFLVGAFDWGVGSAATSAFGERDGFSAARRHHRPFCEKEKAPSPSLWPRTG